MRQLAIVVLSIILLASFIQPLTEVAEACRQKLLINAALNNSFRAARDRSLTEESIQDLDAKMDTGLFYGYFSEAFCDSLDLSERSKSVGKSGYIEFDSSADKFNAIRVEIHIYDDSYEDRDAEEVELHAETAYKFKIGCLKLIQDLAATHYVMEFDKTYLLWVKN